MNSLLRYPIPAFIFLLLLAVGCVKKEIETIYVIQPERKGSLVGYINLVSEFGKPVEDKNGIKVSLEDVVPAVFGFTDSVGRYQMDSIPMGSYTLLFEKPGFISERRTLNFQAGGGNRPALYEDGINAFRQMQGHLNGTWMYQQSTATITDINVIYPRYPADTVNSRDTLVVFKGTYTDVDPINYRKFRFFYDTVPGVSDSRFVGFENGQMFKDGVFDFHLAISKRYNFKKGKTYYGKLYPLPSYLYFSETRRYDPTTGQYKIFPLAPAPEFIFTPRW